MQWTSYSIREKDEQRRLLLLLLFWATTATANEPAIEWVELNSYKWDNIQTKHWKMRAANFHWKHVALVENFCRFSLNSFRCVWLAGGPTMRRSHTHTHILCFVSACVRRSVRAFVFFAFYPKVFAGIAAVTAKKLITFCIGDSVSSILTLYSAVGKYI